MNEITQSERNDIYLRRIYVFRKYNLNLSAISSVRAWLRVQSSNNLNTNAHSNTFLRLVSQKKIGQKKELFWKRTHSCNFGRCLAILISSPNTFRIIHNYMTSTLIVLQFLLSYYSFN